MRKTLTGAAALITAATGLAQPALAGGFSDEIVEDTVIIVEEEPRASLPAWVIPVAIVTAFIIISQHDGEDDSEGGGGEGTLTGLN